MTNNANNTSIFLNQLNLDTNKLNILNKKYFFQFYNKFTQTFNFDINVVPELNINTKQNLLLKKEISLYKYIICEVLLDNDSCN
jgi:hypothetical protein